MTRLYWEIINIWESSLKVSTWTVEGGLRSPVRREPAQGTTLLCDARAAGTLASGFGEAAGRGSWLLCQGSVLTDRSLSGVLGTKQDTATH